MISIYESKQIDKELKVTRLPFGYFYTGVVPEWLLNEGKTQFPSEEAAYEHYERQKSKPHATL